MALTSHDYSPGHESGTSRTLFPVSRSRRQRVTYWSSVPIRLGGPPRVSLTPTEVVSPAHERGCAAIIAHPFRRSDVYESGADFDAVKVNDKHPEDIECVRDLANTLSLPIVGESDAHYPFAVARAFTRIEALRLSRTVVAAIKRAVSTHAFEIPRLQ